MGRLRKANGAHCLVRHYVPYPILDSFTMLFSNHTSNMDYKFGDKIYQEARELLRIITFSDCNPSSKPLFSQTSILSIHQYVFNYYALNKFEATFYNWMPFLIFTYSKVQGTGYFYIFFFFF